MTDTVTAIMTRTLTYWSPLDNYEPVHRTQADGTVEEWLREDGTIAYRIPDGLNAFKDAPRAMFLLDDGHTVQPLYVNGWHVADGWLTLGLFPVNVEADGTPRMRADRAEQVDFSTWALGPRRAYHLKVREA